jgi:hypothetical protein
MSSTSKKPDLLKEPQSRCMLLLRQPTNLRYILYPTLFAITDVDAVNIKLCLLELLAWNLSRGLTCCSICKFFPINDAVLCRLGAGVLANGAARLHREASRQGDCCKSMTHVDNHICRNSGKMSVLIYGVFVITVFLKYVGINWSVFLSWACPLTIDAPLSLFSYVLIGMFSGAKHCSLTTVTWLYNLVRDGRLGINM